MERVPHHRNAPGDFYVEEGRVIRGTCDAVAPALFTADDQHRSVKCQPTPDRELDAKQARYVEYIWKSRNPKVRRRLLERELHQLIDHAE